MVTDQGIGRNIRGRAGVFAPALEDSFAVAIIDSDEMLGEDT